MKLLTDSKQINRTEWRQLVNTSPVSSVFQSPEMYDFFSSIEFYGTNICAIEEKNKLVGVIVVTILHEGGWIKKRLTSRAIIHGGPLIAEDISNEALSILLTSTLRLVNGAIYFETRNYNDYSRWQSVFDAVGFSYQPHYNFHINTSIDPIEKINKTKLYEVRRATREGVTIIDKQPTSQQLKDFYIILEQLYKNKVKVPLPPFDFFQQLSQYPFAHFFLTQYEGQIIGGTICVGNHGKNLYEWYACGKNMRNKHLFPTTMATYSAIRFAYNNTYSLFDMMGAGSPSDNGYGVRDYKSQFGGVLVEYGRYLYVYNKPIFLLGSIYMKLFKGR